MTVSSKTFAELAKSVIDRLVTDTDEPLRQAADLITNRIRAGGIVQAFGTGHSQAAALEIAGRAGGLIPTNRIALADIVHYGGEPPAILADPLLERAPGIAPRLLELIDLAPADVFVIVSNSGINRSIVDMAIEVKARDYPLVAITSTDHSAAVESRHPSGKRLIDLADVVLDNHAPKGDTLLPTAQGVSVCAVSSITTAFIIQMLVAEIVRRLEESGDDIPVYESANTPGGHERNTRVEQRYAGRLRRRAI